MHYIEFGSLLTSVPRRKMRTFLHLLSILEHFNARLLGNVVFERKLDHFGLDFTNLER